MNDAPATPRPAATIILLRRGGRHREEAPQQRRGSAAPRERGLEILLVRRGAGQSFMPGVWVFPGGAIDPGETAAECATRELAEETAIDLGADPELHPWSRWITPEVVPMRFDTWFFVGLAPAHTPPRVDGSEVDDAGWFGPQAALDSNRAGELELVFPTIKTLETLLPFGDAEQVLAAAPARRVEPILPRVVGTRDDHRVLLPGDEGYE